MRYPKMIAPGVAVIGRFNPEPSQLDSATLNDKALSVIAEHELVHHSLAYVAVREPAYNKTLTKNDIVSVWHRDKDSMYGPDNDKLLTMLIWSNREQTQIQLPDGTVFNPTPGDILLVHNDSVMHRTPPEVSDDRWFFRAMVKTPKWMEIAK